MAAENPPIDLERIASVDRVVHEPGRLLVLACLSVVSRANFLYVMRETGQTQGNLSSHLARLESRLDALDARLAGAERPACQPNYVDRGTQQLLAMQYCRDAASRILHDFEASARTSPQQ